MRRHIRSSLRVVWEGRSENLLRLKGSLAFICGASLAADDCTLEVRISACMNTTQVRYMASNTSSTRGKNLPLGERSPRSHLASVP